VDHELVKGSVSYTGKILIMLIKRYKSSIIITTRSYNSAGGKDVHINCILYILQPYNTCPIL